MWLPAAAAVLTCTANGQVADAAGAVVAGIPVNYAEADSGAYRLPDPLRLKNGQPASEAKTWFGKRRPEIRDLIEKNRFGSAPGRPKDMTFEVLERGAPAFHGRVIRRQITIHLTKERNGPYLDLLLYRPANARGPVEAMGPRIAHAVAAEATVGRRLRGLAVERLSPAASESRR